MTSPCGCLYFHIVWLQWYSTLCGAATGWQNHTVKIQAHTVAKVEGSTTARENRFVGGMILIVLVVVVVVRGGGGRSAFVH